MCVLNDISDNKRGIIKCKVITLQALSGIYSKKMSNDKGLIKSFLTQKELDELKGQHVSSHELSAALHAYRAKAILKLQGGVSDIDVKCTT